MLKIGITGNIGGGKTTVSKLFEILGVPVFYADDAAKKVMTADPVLISRLKDAFGPETYFEDGSLNRKYIANIVFNNDEQLEKLNALVHPAVFRAFDEWASQIRDKPYVIKEAALLFESSSYKMCDYSIMVTAPLELRIERVMKRDKLTRAEVESRNSRQFSEEKKTKLADFVVRNDDTELVIPQVLKLHEKFLSLVNDHQAL
ncbi:MAG TPA: dephospho-CoA kinase [Mucilaginibacter sp.]|nr:dephospho-CoA kinase [Mucilaginibacter sp.]